MKKLKIRKLNNKIKETVNENNYQDKNGNFNLIKILIIKKCSKIILILNFFEYLNITNKIITHFKNNSLKKY